MIQDWKYAAWAFFKLSILLHIYRELGSATRSSEYLTWLIISIIPYYSVITDILYGIQYRKIIAAHKFTEFSRALGESYGVLIDDDGGD